MSDPISDEELEWARHIADWNFNMSRAVLARLDAAESKLAAAEAVIEAARGFLTFAYGDRLPFSDPKSQMVKLATEIHNALAAYDRALSTTPEDAEPKNDR